MIDQEIPEEHLGRRTSLLGCPKCKGKVQEVWHTHTKAGKVKRKFKLIATFCISLSCGFDLFSIPVPEPKLTKL